MSAIARVIGIDPSLTSTGVAARHHSGTWAVGTMGRKGKRGEDLPTRYDRIQTLTEDVLSHAPVAHTSLVVIEAPSFGQAGGSVVDRNGLWWYLVGWCLKREAMVVTVSPTTRAKWATGSGRADKAAVASAVTRILPEVDLPNSDSADAVVLALMGCQRIGWLTGQETKYRAEALAAVKWPEALDA